MDDSFLLISNGRTEDIKENELKSVIKLTLQIAKNADFLQVEKKISFPK